MGGDRGDDSTRLADASADTVASNAGYDATLPPPARADGEARPDYADLVTVDPSHYVLDHEIARGGMGRIRVARDRRLGRVVAVKEILVKGGDAGRRFEREARITARLQHPSIVNIHEAGVWPSGEPFYAMKLVSGRSLDDVVAGAATLDERLALLPNVLAVADAIAYAHGERVIHRDLKPRNVLVGAFGETVVIDWGLAKDLADSSRSDGSSGPARRAAAGPGETAFGDVMGTPAYMPPEQAEGVPVDERADVYAIGAILDHVLGGRPPYSGSSSDEILDAVKRAPPRSLAERQPGVPPDLLAIVERAMARDPAARYPTARELAEDLRRYQTGQLVGAHDYSLRQLVRRWLRRYRAAVSVAAIALVVLAVIGAIALERVIRAEHRAEEQRALAAASRGRAEDLLGFMLVDLRAKLDSLGRLDILDDVAKKAVAYYDGRGGELSDTEQRDRAIARRSLGDVLSAQGHADAALRELRASLDAFEALAARDPSDADRQSDVSLGHAAVGDVLLRQGDTAGAVAEFGRALAVVEAMVARAPSHAEGQRALAVAHTKLGKVLFSARADAAGALVHLRAAVAVREALAAKDRTSVDRQADVALARGRIGDVLLQQGDTEGALSEFRTAVAIVDGLATSDPGNPVREEERAVAHSKIGDALLAKGDVTGALAEFRIAQVEYEMLAAKDPTNVDRQLSLLVSHEQIGDALMSRGDAAGALVEYRACLAIAETQAPRDPTSASWRQTVSSSRIRVGDALLAQDDTAGALAAYRAALAVRDALAAQDPTNSDRQRDLFVAHVKIGGVLLDRGDHDGALEQNRAALTITERLASLDPTNGERQRDLLAAHAYLGGALLAKGDAAAALIEHRAQLAIAEALAAKDPTNADRPIDLIDGHTSVGDALLATGDRAGAKAEYQAAYAIARDLAAKAPDDAALKRRASELAAKLRR